MLILNAGDFYICSLSVILNKYNVTDINIPKVLHANYELLK